MSYLGGICFDSKEDLFAAIEREFNSVGLKIVSRHDHQYHFIIEVVHEEEKIGRLKVHYKKDYKCKKVNILDPMNSTLFQMISRILPISKGAEASNDTPYDFLTSFFRANYRYTVDIIYLAENFTCYEIKHPSKELFVWIKVFSSEEQSCQYVNGDSDYFDEINYIYEEEIIGNKSLV